MLLAAAAIAHVPSNAGPLVAAEVTAFCCGGKNIKHDLEKSSPHMLLHLCNMLPAELGNKLAEADKTIATQFQSIPRDRSRNMKRISAIDQVQAVCGQQRKNKKKGKLLPSNQKDKEASGHSSQSNTASTASAVKKQSLKVKRTLQ